MRRRPVITLGLVLLVLGVFSLLLYAGDKKEKPKYISGTLVDTKCYAMGGFVLNDHKDMKGNKMPNCATACAVMGIPVAVLDGDKNVHVIAGPASGYSKWMAMEVRLTGMYGKYAEVFIPESIEVKEKGKWVKKDLPGAMM
jgi:hypothetical protein